MTKVIVLVVIVLVGVYLLCQDRDLNPFASHTTITTTVVLGKLTKIEQVHVATRSYPVTCGSPRAWESSPAFSSATRWS